jgi:hypothetical protein
VTSCCFEQGLAIPNHSASTSSSHALFNPSLPPAKLQSWR